MTTEKKTTGTTTPITSASTKGDLYETFIPGDQIRRLHSASLTAGDAFGRYEIVRELGRGAMGVVYLALDTNLDRQIALKIPFFGNSADGDTVERFYREARAMATISHSNLCPVYDVGEIEGMHYLTMRFVDGRPMSDYLKGGKSHPAKQTAAIIRKLALALDVAHRNGIVHRDLKPANIMIGIDGEPIIMDFGLARRTKGNESTLTHDGQVMGTPAYMSPEQIRGNQAEVGPASDVYSLGVICFQLLTGKLPFHGSIGEVMSAVLTQPAPKPSLHGSAKIDRTMDAICMKLMAKQPANRYASAAAVQIAFKDYLRGKRIHPAQPLKPADDLPLEIQTSEAQSTPAEESNRSIVATATEAELAHDFFAEFSVIQKPKPQVIRKQVPAWVWLAGGGGIAAAVLLMVCGFLIASAYLTTPSHQRPVAENNRREAVQPESVFQAFRPITPPTANSDSANRALLFDDLADVVAVTNVDVSKGPITVEAFVKQDSVDITGVLVRIGGTQSASLFSEANRVGFSVSIDGKSYYGVSQTPLPQGRFVHVAGVFDGQTSRVYLNGKLVDAVAWEDEAIQELPPAIYIGADSPGASGFRGSIDEVRISSGIRYEKEFEPPESGERFETDTSTISLYHFDESSGDRAEDASGNRLHGELFGVQRVRIDHAPLE